MNFDLCICLRIKGFAKAETIAETANLSIEQAQQQLDALIARHWAENTRMGVRLTAEGKAEADRLIAAERDMTDASRTKDLYERFCDLNNAFKSLVTDWQMRSVDGATIVNSHQDEDYDRSVLERLDDLHPRMLQLIGDLAQALPRLGGYGPRFDVALERIRKGETRYLTAPIIDSYHTVWFELHQDLIQVCGLNRSDEAAAGRAH